MAVFRAVVGYEGLYEVSDDGAVRSLRSGVRAPHMLKPAINRRGYAVVHLRRNGEGRGRLVSRLVAEAFHGPPPGPMYAAAHNNGVPGDNRASNLRWATYKDNDADKDIHGTRLKGETHSQARLVESQVIEIRRRFAKSELCRHIAADFGISTDTVRNIAHGKTWRHVGGTITPALPNVRGDLNGNSRAGKARDRAARA